METSSFIIICVNRMTIDEQKLVSQITQEYAGKKIFVIHNFSETTDEKEIRDYRELEFKACFDLKYVKHRCVDNTLVDVYYDYSLNEANPIGKYFCLLLLISTFN
jgi:hypothetical protein